MQVNIEEGGRNRSSSVSEPKGAEIYELFNKSRKTPRSPTVKRKFTQETGHDEEIMAMLKDMRLEISKMREEIKDDNKSTKKIIEELKEEINQLRQKEDAWKTEKGKLIERIEKLENKEEEQEKRKKRNNIIISGAEIKCDDLKKNVLDFLSKQLNIEPEISEVYQIPKIDKVVVILKDWEEKQKIMMNKSKLKGKRIFIDNDQTPREREIQAKLRKLAKDERDRGNFTKVTYKKLKINDKWYVWNEKEDKLEESTWRDVRTRESTK